MPRYIDADKLLSGYDVRKVTEYDESGCGVDYKAVPVKAIEAAPTVDAVPVVRCRDCKYFMEYTNEHRFASAYDGDCGMLAGYTDCEREARKYMDYCSYGERKGKQKHEMP